MRLPLPLLSSQSRLARLIAGATLLGGIAALWLLAQVLVFNVLAPLRVSSPLAAQEGNWQPADPVSVDVHGWSAVFASASLVRTPREGGLPEAVPVDVEHSSGSTWAIHPTDHAPLLPDSTYQLTVLASTLGPGLPLPRRVEQASIYQFNTPTGPAVLDPGAVRTLTWGQPVAVDWNMPMRSITASVAPVAPLRTWIDPTNPARTWLQLGSTDGHDLVDGTLYRVLISEADSTDGLPLPDPVQLALAAPTRPRFLDLPAAPASLSLGQSLVLHASQELDDVQVQSDSGTVLRVSGAGSRVSLSFNPATYLQGQTIHVTLTGVSSASGAPLAGSVSLTITTPPPLPPPTFSPANSAQDTPLATQPALDFLTPVANPAAVAAAAAISPSVTGAWQWTTPTRLVFMPDADLPPTTTFTLGLPGGVGGPRAADGSYLQQAASTTFTTAPEKLIDVSLSRQSMDLVQGGAVVKTLPVATGVADAPTPTGTFMVRLKAPSMHFQGTNPDGSHYDIPDVHWVLPFSGDYTIHGAYWRTRFGVPGSDGCVSLSDADAKFVYDWADVGTPIVIHP